MIENFFTRCAIQDTPLLRLKERIIREKPACVKRMKGKQQPRTSKKPSK